MVVGAQELFKIWISAQRFQFWFVDQQLPGYDSTEASIARLMGLGFYAYDASCCGLDTVRCDNKVAMNDFTGLQHHGWHLWFVVDNQLAFPHCYTCFYGRIVEDIMVVRAVDLPIWNTILPWVSGKVGKALRGTGLPGAVVDAGWLRANCFHLGA